MAYLLIDPRYYSLIANNLVVATEGNIVLSLVGNLLS